MAYNTKSKTLMFLSEKLAGASLRYPTYDKELYVGSCMANLATLSLTSGVCFPNDHWIDILMIFFQFYIGLGMIVITSLLWLIDLVKWFIYSLSQN